MGEQVKVDLDGMAGIAKRLGDGASALDKIWESAPESVDAGDLSDVIAGDFAYLLSNAGHLVINMQSAAAAVTTAASNYRTTDSSSANDYEDD